MKHEGIIPPEIYAGSSYPTDDSVVCVYEATSKYANKRAQYGGDNPPKFP